MPSVPEIPDMPPMFVSPFGLFKTKDEKVVIKKEAPVVKEVAPVVEVEPIAKEVAIPIVVEKVVTKEEVPSVKKIAPAAAVEEVAPAVTVEEVSSAEEVAPAVEVVPEEEEDTPKETLTESRDESVIEEDDGDKKIVETYEMEYKKTAPTSDGKGFHEETKTRSMKESSFVSSSGSSNGKPVIQPSFV